VNDAQDQQKTKTCPACGGRLAVLVRTAQARERTPIAYYKCEHCAHVFVVEE
jgi:DNA-directed RNA polymerase subunit M/transcription elongation factor TFIIS